MAVDPAANKIYVSHQNTGGTVTIIDGTNNSTSNISTTGTFQTGIAVNPVTHKVYLANQGTANVSVITSAPNNPLPLSTFITEIPGNSTTNSGLSFTLTATSTYSPTAPPPANIYFQMDTTNGEWTRATNTGGTATTVTATASPTGLQSGVHIVYFFATDGLDATSINPRIKDPLQGNAKISLDILAPETSPIIGGINSYLFLVKPAVNLSGRVTTPTGLGLRNAVVALTDQAGVRITATTSSFGVYSFNNIRSDESYLIGVASKRFRFASRSVVVAASDVTGVDFTGLE